VCGCLGFDPRNAHLEDLYRETFATRRDNVSRIWDTLKFTTTIFSALLSALVALTLGYFQFQTSLICAHVEPYVQWLIFAIAFGVLATSVLSLFNFRREYERVLEATVIVKKIEHVWGLYEPITNVKHKYFKGDEHVTLEKYIQGDNDLFQESVSTDKEWVHLKMGYVKSLGSMWTGADALGTITPFYCLYILISTISTILLTLIFPQNSTWLINVMLIVLILAFVRIMVERVLVQNS